MDNHNKNPSALLTTQKQLDKLNLNSTKIIFCKIFAIKKNLFTKEDILNIQQACVDLFIDTRVYHNLDNKSNIVSEQINSDKPTNEQKRKSILQQKDSKMPKSNLMHFFKKNAQ